MGFCVKDWAFDWAPFCSNISQAKRASGESLTPWSGRLPKCVRLLRKGGTPKYGEKKAIKKPCGGSQTAQFFVRKTNYLCVFSLLTVNFLRPLARREAITRRPLAVAIRSLNPCLFFLLRCDGWKVRFMLVYFNVVNFSKTECKYRAKFCFDKFYLKKA